MLLLILTIFATECKAQTITSFSPASGPIGTTVTILGTNFRTTPTANTVYFGATRGVVTTATATRLSVIVPAWAPYEPISVSVNGVIAYSSQSFVLTFQGGEALAVSTAQETFRHPNPGTVKIGDLDGDGKSDLVMLDYEEKVISVMRNTSNSGNASTLAFADEVNFTTGNHHPSSVSINDYDSDGKLDLVVSFLDYSSTYPITYTRFNSVFKNTSTSGSITTNSFAPGVEIPMVTGTLGDLDGDGKQDLAFGNVFYISVQRNISASGSITPDSFGPAIDFPIDFPVYAFDGIFAQDLDGDSKADLVSPSSEILGSYPNYRLKGTISIFKNTSTIGSITSNSFAPKVDFISAEGANTGHNSGISMAIGDLSGDQKPDLAVSNLVNNSISVFKNTSVAGILTADSFEKIEFGTGKGPNNIRMTDLDGDGKVDLVFANSLGSSVSILRNNSSTGKTSFEKIDIWNNFFSPFAYSPDDISVNVNDLDGDGKPEIIVAYASKNIFGTAENFLAILKPVIKGIPVIHDHHVSVPKTPINPTPIITVPAPIITEISKNCSSTAVSISGKNFDPIPSNNVVLFNGKEATVTVSSAASISTFLPIGVAFGPVQVVVQSLSGGYSNPFSFTFGITPPKPIISIDPSNPNVLISSTGDSYDWFRDGNHFAITQSVVADVTGQYYVDVTVNQCVSPFSDPKTIIITGDISKSTFEVSIYPVPARDQLFVRGTSLESGNLRVMNVLGKECHPPIELSGDGAVVDIRELTSGVIFSVQATARRLFTLNSSRNRPI